MSAAGQATAVPLRYWRAGLGVALAIVLLGSLAATGWRVHVAHRQLALGQTLFEGMATQPDRRLTGAMPGHDRALPAAAARCVNCHTGSAANTPGFASPLHAGTLTRALPRRGGPPSRYDASSLCRVLREGIDPAWVLVGQAMPRYQASDAQCAALWAWLTRPERRPPSGRTPSPNLTKGKADDAPT